MATTGIAVLAFLLLTGIGALMDRPLLIPPLAASMALIVSVPDLPLSQPRSVVGSHLLGALTGFAAVAVAGPGAWGAAVASGVTLGVMALARTPHSPAAATALFVALQPPTGPVLPAYATFLGLLVLATCLVVVLGWAGNRVLGRAYPRYWW
ncbi:HPP family protein [Streptomyces sp. NPDC003077]|uniref:HPP family protein n=1 Tax=Streptomyces sp. NPDC003077 TaxID=3154443 RepID=UPI0033B14906